MCRFRILDGVPSRGRRGEKERGEERGEGRGERGTEEEKEEGDGAMGRPVLFIYHIVSLYSFSILMSCMVTTLRIFLARRDWDRIPGISCRVSLAGIGVFGTRLLIEFYLLSRNSDLSAET